MVIKLFENVCNNFLFSKLERNYTKFSSSTGVVLKVESLPRRTPMGSLNNTSSEAGSTFEKPKKENWCGVAAQIFIPFMIAGMGTIGAGIVLGSVEVNIIV